MRSRPILLPAARFAGLVACMVAATAALLTPDALTWPRLTRAAAAVALAFVPALAHGALTPRRRGRG